MSPIGVSRGRTSSETLDSFTQMADKDLESIGRHCQYEYCHQLDFLPFRCESCRGTYCLDHRTETAHHCPKEGEWARRRNNNNNNNNTSTTTGPPTQKPTIYNTEQCAHVACKTLINTMKDPAVRCPNCNRQYCLKHRLREEHECAKIAPLGARAGGQGANSAETIRSMFARVRTWGKEKGAAGAARPKSGAAARVSELNALKKAAKGDAGVPVEKRLYVHVVGTAETQKAEPPRGEFWFDSRWKVGRVLDDAAKRLRVENVNNRAGEEERLRIFHLESGEFLEFAETIGAGKVKQGHTLVLLRGAGVMLGKS
ncbi:AN1-type zinc finger protein [Aspergillus clavatus NRRL 1]|uniref:AN1 zinc finger protein n=1 Tax=Aspergillus clavatus (strain ATCC 1007 / CBS 513.65 / DSM 816 / NCTC 3887 / NRRL 1 / QM 1276 / 107) TaxID=344612 RepID=A1C941_ASPCL|nr:AN1 zinc finger protein [Aspergillus clavatus NRRL 1]EAW13365.1 AN1 zinc finger protein [Aspergillus clavatus NRRL 1]